MQAGGAERPAVEQLWRTSVLASAGARAGAPKLQHDIGILLPKLLCVFQAFCMVHCGRAGGEAVWVVLTP